MERITQKTLHIAVGITIGMLLGVLVALSTLYLYYIYLRA